MTCGLRVGLLTWKTNKHDNFRNFTDIFDAVTNFPARNDSEDLLQFDEIFVKMT